MGTPLIANPGVKVRGDAERRDILFGLGGALLEAGGEVVDGANARDLGNGPADTDTIRAGVMLGKITASGKYGVAVIGPTAVPHDTSATPNVLTVPPAVAAELVRRSGPTGDFKITGPAVADTAPVNTETVTPVSINTTTGAIDITGSTTTNDYAAGSFIQPADGSETIVALLKDLFGINANDQDKVDQDASATLLISGQVDVDKIVDYPTDTAQIAFVKAALRLVGIGFTFSDDV